MRVLKKKKRDKNRELCIDCRSHIGFNFGTVRLSSYLIASKFSLVFCEYYKLSSSRSSPPPDVLFRLNFYWFHVWFEKKRESM
jgi:hypothetical protein